MKKLTSSLIICLSLFSCFAFGGISSPEGVNDSQFRILVRINDNVYLGKLGVIGEPITFTHEGLPNDLPGVIRNREDEEKRLAAAEDTTLREFSISVFPTKITPNAIEASITIDVLEREEGKKGLRKNYESESIDIPIGFNYTSVDINGYSVGFAGQRLNQN